MYNSTPTLLPMSKFRHYRVRLKDNKFVKIKDKIHTPEQLKKHLDKLMPFDVYNTISWWLNPEYLGSRKAQMPKFRSKEAMVEYRTNNLLNNFFLGSDYMMDFDGDDYKSKEEMLDNVKLAKLKLNEMGLHDFTLVRTGRGYQLWVMDFWKWAKISVKHPRDREYACQKKMVKLTSELRKAGIKWDYNVSIDTRRLARVIKTFHRNGVLIEKIT